MGRLAVITEEWQKTREALRGDVGRADRALS
jgi:hypothetical protein